MTRSWRYRLTVAGGLVLLIGIGLVLRLRAEPVDDDRVSLKVTASPAATLLPPDYPRDDVEMFGQLLSVWDEEKVRVVQYRGDFRLDFGRRRLSADNAVIWIALAVVDGKAQKQFTVYLEGNVRVVELGGTTLTDTRHLVTFETTGRIWTDANTRGEPDRSDSELYRRAKTFRDRPDVRARHRRAAPPKRPAAPAPPRGPIRYQAVRTIAEVRGEERVILAEGKVYINRSDPVEPAKGKMFVEMWADRAVLFAREGKVQKTLSRATTRPDWQEVITGAYLEGAVVLSRGERSIRASRLYYDFDHDRALILDAILFERHESREVPMIIWADQIRQLSETEMVLHDAQITSSAMNTPVFSLRAAKVYLRDETDREAPYASAQYDTGHYKTRHERMQVRGVPLSYWPASRGTLGERETALRTVRFGFDSDFGAFLEAQWHAFKLLGLKEPKGFDVYLNTDVYSRGPRLGLEADWKRDNFRGYGIADLVFDRGSDSLGDEREEDEEETDDKDDKFEDRGRILVRHRHYLKNNWELTAELSYLSDRTFLEEWYEKEFDVGKEQETLVYLKKAEDNWAFTALAKVRINNFLNQAEKFPEVKFYKLGEPLWNDRLVYYGENSLGAFRYAVDEERTDRSSSGGLVRGDTRHELQIPLRSGPFRIVPYAVGRLTGWSSTADKSDEELAYLSEESDSSGGGMVRLFGALGVNVSTVFSRVFDRVESRFWDVHRLRHVIKPELNVHIAANGVERDELLPLDGGNESINGSSAITLAARQRLQTKRGGPGAWRNVDWMILDLEGTIFANEPTRTNFEPEFTRPPSVRYDNWSKEFIRGEFFNYRPENSLARSTFNWYYQWRVSDTMTLLWDGNIGSGGLDRTNIGVSVQRSPRWRMYAGMDYIAALDSNQLLFQSHYKINRKYDMLFSYAHDTIEGEMASVQFTLIRKVQRFYVALTFDMSNTKDREMVMVSVWPEGAPEVTLGRTDYSDIGSTMTSTRRQ